MYLYGVEVCSNLSNTFAHCHFQYAIGPTY